MLYFHTLPDGSLWGEGDDGHEYRVAPASPLCSCGLTDYHWHAATRTNNGYMRSEPKACMFDAMVTAEYWEATVQ